MSLADPFAPVDKVRRNGIGQYLVLPPDAKKEKGYQRATNFVKLAKSTDWGPRDLRFLAEGLTEHHAEFAPAIRAAETPGALTKVIQRILERTDCHAGRNWGTAMHAITEGINRGESPFVPSDMKRDVDAYYAALQAEGIEILPEYMERMVVLDDYAIAGQLDNIVRDARTGKLHIADLKTGKSVYVAEVALQLFIYRSGLLYDQATQERTALPEGLCDETALVFHLPKGEGRCVIHEVPLSIGRDGFTVALAVRGWGTGAKSVARPEHSAPLDVLDTSAPRQADRIQALRERAQALKTAGHTNTLRAHWPQGVPGFLADHIHSGFELEQIESALWRAEAQHTMPFPPDSEPAPVPVATPHPAARPVPDEGRSLTEEEVAATQAAIGVLVESKKAWLRDVWTESGSYGCILSVSRFPTERRLALVTAAVQLAHLGDDELIRSVLYACTDAEACHFPTTHVGKVISALTIAEAVAVATLASVESLSVIADEATGLPKAVAA